LKFIIQRDLLVESVQDVIKAFASRTTLPILTGIKMTASSTGETLTGSLPNKVKAGFLHRALVV